MYNASQDGMEEDNIVIDYNPPQIKNRRSRRRSGRKSKSDKVQRHNESMNM